VSCLCVVKTWLFCVSLHLFKMSVAFDDIIELVLDLKRNLEEKTSVKMTRFSLEKPVNSDMTHIEICLKTDDGGGYCDFDVDKNNWSECEDYLNDIIEECVQYFPKGCDGEWGVVIASSNGVIAPWERD